MLTAKQIDRVMKVEGSLNSVVTTNGMLTDIETELLNELKGLVYQVESFREGYMGETGKVYTGSVSEKRLRSAKEVIERAEAIRNGES